MSQRIISYSDLTAEVYSYTEAKGIYWLKLTWGDSGMYTTSFTVRNSKLPDQKWWVQQPKYAPHWKSPFEFAKTSELWIVIERLCIEAVESYGKDTVITDIEGVDIEKELDKTYDALENERPP